MSYAFHVVGRYADGTQFTDPTDYLSPVRAAQAAERFKQGGHGRTAHVKRVKVRDNAGR